MVYEQTRGQITDGDLLFFRGRLLHSRIIQRWSRSVFSHVGIAHWIRSAGVERLAVVEAIEGHGVRLYPLSVSLERGDDVDWFQITDDSIAGDRVVGWAMARWGKRYATARQFVRSFLSIRLATWLGLPTRLADDRWFCSWFAAEALRAGGWQPPDDDTIRPELAAPGDVALFSCIQRKGPLRLSMDSDEDSR